MKKKNLLFEVHQIMYIKLTQQNHSSILFLLTLLIYLTLLIFCIVRYLQYCKIIK